MGPLPKQVVCHKYPSLCFTKLSLFDEEVEKCVKLAEKQLGSTTDSDVNTTTVLISFFVQKSKSIYDLLGSGEDKVYYEQFFIRVRTCSRSLDSTEEEQYADLVREERMLRKELLKAASFCNVKLLPLNVSSRQSNPLFELTLVPKKGDQEGKGDPKSWFNIFG